MCTNNNKFCEQGHKIALKWRKLFSFSLLMALARNQKQNKKHFISVGSSSQKLLTISFVHVICLSGAMEIEPDSFRLFSFLCIQMIVNTYTSDCRLVINSVNTFSVIFILKTYLKVVAAAADKIASQNMK